jgi:Outer membrane protein beta-barrel domain
MRKLIVGAVVVLASAVAAPVAQAQQQSAVTFGVSGGLTLPIGDLGDAYGSGFNLQGHANYKPSSLPFGLRGDVGFWTTAGKTVNLGGISGKSKGITWISGTANVVYNFEGAKDATFVPYVIGGAGLYNGSQSIGTKFGVNGGGGVTFKLSGFDAFAEARFHNIFTDNITARIIPISFGINFKP